MSYRLQKEEDDDPSASPSQPAVDGTTERDLDALLRDHAAIAGAITAAYRDLVRRHALLGLPLVTWRDGCIVEEVPSLEDLDAFPPSKE